MSAFIARTGPDLFARLKDGDAAQEWYEAMQRGAAKVEEIGNGKAVITFTVTIEKDRGVFDVVSKLTEKMPAAPEGRTLLWATPEGNFSLTDPRQISLGLRDASADTRFRVESGGSGGVRDA